MSGFQAIGALIIRIWAIGVIFSSAVSLALLLFVQREAQNGRVGGEISVWFVAGILAWLFATRLAKIGIPASAPGNVSIAMGETEFVAVGSFLIGAFFLAEHLPAFVVGLAALSFDLIDREANAPIELTMFDVRRFASETLLLAIAFALTFRARDVANMFSSLRSAGLAKAE